MFLDFDRSPTEAMSRVWTGSTCWGSAQAAGEGAAAAPAQPVAALPPHVGRPVGGAAAAAPAAAAIVAPAVGRWLAEGRGSRGARHGCRCLRAPHKNQQLPRATLPAQAEVAALLTTIEL